MLVINLMLFLSICFFIITISYLIYKNRELTTKLKSSEGKNRDLANKYKLVSQELDSPTHDEETRYRKKDLLQLHQSKFTVLNEISSSMEQEWIQHLNSLSLLVQDVREARAFGEIDDLYIDTFINESMSQIKHLTQSVSDFRKFQLDNAIKEAFSVGDSIEYALTLFSSSLHNHNIHVNFEYHGQQMGYGYLNEFSYMLLIMFIKVRDAFLANGIQNKKIYIHLNETESFVTVDIQDNAGKIESEDLLRIMEADVTTDFPGGELELYMAKIILERMDGRISFESTSEGTRFLLELPKACKVINPVSSTM
ncbi:signal transduction histidine kinase [Bacillus sp. SORGH_AS 510]|uniref:ATP-binding protein n=1 Tax=Bacillus sp. SORGH_AS_0510 TaxID=3041771 RepID=UPI00278AE67D|nr:HAMP domain-containing sensor histidine kinase [Bacillus sp. SORGH_AS_0510]MDQ1145874.1 signal transduction histidine kinase [Bacillus sp. SORGH_AS_0510]